LFTGICYNARKLVFWAMLSYSLCGVAGMTHEFLTKPKMSNAERHDRFVAMMQQMGTLDGAKNFEKAFQKAFKSAFENVARWRRIAGARTNGAGLRRRFEGN
jgi:hypothetical protein